MYVLTVPSNEKQKFIGCFLNFCFLLIIFYTCVQNMTKYQFGQFTEILITEATLFSENSITSFSKNQETVSSI